MKSRSLLTGYFMICIFITAAAGFFLLSIPGDPKNQVLLGLSLPRLAIMVGFLVFFGLAAAGMIKNLRSTGWSDAILEKFLAREDGCWRWIVFFLAGLGLGWFGSLTPADTLPAFEAYLLRFKPVFYWLTAISIVSLFVLAAVCRDRFFANRPEQGSGRCLISKKVVGYTSAAFALMLLIWLFIQTTGVGLVPVSFWQKTGVPILSGQAFLVWTAGLAIIFLVGVRGRRSRQVSPLPTGGDQKRSPDRWIFLLIWAVTAILWNLEPLPHSHFAPGPFPPDYQNYPYSDAAVYDTCAEFALIGQGLCNLQYADKPLYSFFLLVLHLLSASRFDLLILLQVCVFALLPPILYWLGASIHSRLAGGMIALLAIFKGINSISGTLVIWDISNPKFLMSEVPMLLMLAAFTFFLVRFVQDPAKNLNFLVLSAGMLGLATLIRHNAWFLLPFGLLIPFLFRSFPLRARSLFSLLFLGVFVLTTLPWMVRSAVVSHNPFYVVIPFRGLVASERLEEKPSAGQPVEEQVQDNQPVVDEVNIRQHITVADVLERIGHNLSPMAGHLFHNLLTSVLTLPPTVQFEDLASTVADGSPFWDRYWDGSMNFASGLMLILNSTVLAAGLGIAFRRWRWTGLIPLFVFLLYAAGNALAKTSGGRYVVPMDWVVYFYYGIGAAGFLLLTSRYLGFPTSGLVVQRPVNQESLRELVNFQGLLTRPVILSLLAVILVGTMIPMTDFVFPQKYTPRTDQELVESLYARGVLNSAVDSSADLIPFVEREDVVVLEGKGMYPRYIDPANELSQEVFNYLDIREPTLVFQVINSGHSDYRDAEWLVTMPLENPPGKFPGGVDTIVIGCVSDDHVDALLIVLQPAMENIVFRRSSSAWSCPTDK